jgi:hypothetical protein
MVMVFSSSKPIQPEANEVDPAIAVLVVNVTTRGFLMSELVAFFHW